MCEAERKRRDGKTSVCGFILYSHHSFFPPHSTDERCNIFGFSFVTKKSKDLLDLWHIILQADSESTKNTNCRFAVMSFKVEYLLYNMFLQNKQKSKF
jgi:hypothetical protein